MPRPLSYRKEINNMSVPYVPTADFSIYSDDPETLAKAEINGLYLGVSESSPYTYTHTAIMAWITPKNIHPKIFFQKVTNTSYNIYVCSNIVLNDSSAYYILHGVSTSGEEGYGLYTHAITTPFTITMSFYCDNCSPTVIRIRTIFKSFRFTNRTINNFISVS